MPYEFIPSVVRYRDTETGRFVPRATVVRYSELSIIAGSDAAADLAALVSSGQISPADWEQLLRQEIKATFIQEAIVGRGGRASMTPSDWGTVGRALRDQYAYLDGFRQDIEDGLLSEAQIRARSHLYFLASKAAFERGQAAAWGIDLPGYPTVDTICQTGDKCYWNIRRIDDRTVLASWVRTAAESCATCLQRADDWAELEYVNGVLKTPLAQPGRGRHFQRSGLLAAAPVQVALPA
ncbi:MAG: hypothetical protein ABI690_13500 [Chloroflexota bacterium]